MDWVMNLDVDWMMVVVVVMMGIIILILLNIGILLSNMRSTLWSLWDINEELRDTIAGEKSQTFIDYPRPMLEVKREPSKSLYWEFYKFKHDVHTNRDTYFKLLGDIHRSLEQLLERR